MCLLPFFASTEKNKTQKGSPFRLFSTILFIVLLITLNFYFIFIFRTIYTNISFMFQNIKSLFILHGHMRAEKKAAVKTCSIKTL